MGKIIDNALREILQQECNAPCDESPEALLSDLRQVGPSKPMGYLPLSTITRLCGTTPGKLADEARSKGLEVEICRPACPVLFVWDRNALQNLLNKNHTVLQQAGWPTSADQFAKQIFIETASAQTPLFDLIADAYADYRNPGRLELREPLSSPTVFAAQHAKRDPHVPDSSSWGKGKQD